MLIYFLLPGILLSIFLIYEFIIISKNDIYFGGKLGKFIRMQYWYSWLDLVEKTENELYALNLVDKNNITAIKEKEELLKYLEKNEPKVC